MKRFLIVCSAMAIGLLSSGCATWSGVKQDSNKAWKATKKTVHDATED